jgi:hypothetical protein
VEGYYGKSWFLADLAACEAYLQSQHLTPVCDTSVKALILDRIIGMRAPEVTDHLDVLERVPVLDRPDLAHVVWENPDWVWVSCGTQFGLQIAQSPLRVALRRGHPVGVAGVSALSDGYAGLFLYEWGGGGLGAKLKKFYGGIETSLAEGG